MGGACDRAGFPSSPSPRRCPAPLPPNGSSKWSVGGERCAPRRHFDQRRRGLHAEPGKQRRELLPDRGLAAGRDRDRPTRPAGQNGPVLFTLSWRADDVGRAARAYVRGRRGHAPEAGHVRHRHVGGLSERRNPRADPAHEEAQLLRDDRRRADGSSDREPGSGTTSTRLNEPDGVLVYEVTATGIANGSTATARLGAPGQNGPAPLRSSARAEWCGVSPFLSASDVAAIKAGGVYYQVESPAFPAGEIRGQLVPAPAVFSCVLDGAQAVPPTSSSATGCGWLDLDPAASIASFEVGVTGLSSPVTARTFTRG